MRYFMPDISEPEEPEAPPETSLAFLQSVYRDPNQSMTRRMQAAIAALKFEHPALSVSGTVNHRGMATVMEAYRSASERGNTIEMKACTDAFKAIGPVTKPRDCAVAPDSR
jgi:hypothetical protein